MKIPDDAEITLISNDGEKFKITAKAAKLSTFIANSPQFPDEDEDEESDDLTPIVLDFPVPRVDGATLRLIVSFLEQFERSPFPPMPDTYKGKTFKDNIADEFYSNFMKELVGDESDEALDKLYEVKAAGNFMDITPLLEMICLWMTFRCDEIRDGDKIRRILRIDFSEDEESKLRKEQPWMFVKAQAIEED